MKKPGEGPRGPNVCGVCGCPFLQADEWARLDFSTWKVTVRCPNCSETTDTVLVEDELRELYRSLEDGVRDVERALETCERESFEEECHVLIRALRSNSVYPMDF